jgi:hypothetical protein
MIKSKRLIYLILAYADNAVIDTLGSGEVVLWEQKLRTGNYAFTDTGRTCT